MKIVVFVKQVPDNTKLKLDQVGDRLPREGVDMMVNPYDEYALETAVRLKEAAGGESTVTVLSLGGASAKEVLKKAVAVGCDDAFLLSDPAFNDGDSTATANALAQAVKTFAPDFNVLVFGQMSLDDAASQTGPKVAELLNVPSLTACKGAEILSPDSLKVSRETERGYEVHEMTLPGVVCMMKCDYELRTANIKGVMKANKTEIPVKSLADIGLEASKAGAAGSTSAVTKVWQRPAKSGGKVVDGSNAQQAVNDLVQFLKDAKVL